MRELKACLDIRREITEIEEKIFELREAVAAPKNQVITGMPRGGASDNVLDKYLIKVERLENRKNDLCVELHNKWNIVKMKLANANECKGSTLKILKLRFYHGCSWNKCVGIITKIYPDENWNINKAFRVYGKINKII